MRALDEAEEFDDHLYAKLNEFGVLGIDAPAALGGSGDVRDQLVVIEELAAGPTSMAAFMIVQYMIIQVLGAFASTDEQRSVLRELGTAPVGSRRDTARIASVGTLTPVGLFGLVMNTAPV